MDIQYKEKIEHIIKTRKKAGPATASARFAMSVLEYHQKTK